MKRETGKKGFVPKCAAINAGKRLACRISAICPRPYLRVCVGALDVCIRVYGCEGDSVSVDPIYILGFLWTISWTALQHPQCAYWCYALAHLSPFSFSFSFTFSFSLFLSVTPLVDGKWKKAEWKKIGLRSKRNLSIREAMASIWSQTQGCSFHYMAIGKRTTLECSQRKAPGLCTYLSWVPLF